MTQPTQIKVGGDIEFIFDRGGLPIAGFTCQVQMKQYPDDTPTISFFEEADPNGRTWSGIITSPETENLNPGLWFLTAELKNTATGQQRQITGAPTRVEVGKSWY
jgi:hypothetical protein